MFLILLRQHGRRGNLWPVRGLWRYLRVAGPRHWRRPGGLAGPAGGPPRQLAAPGPAAAGPLPAGLHTAGWQPPHLPHGEAWDRADDGLVHLLQQPGSPFNGGLLRDVQLVEQPPAGRDGAAAGEHRSAAGEQRPAAGPARLLSSLGQDQCTGTGILSTTHSHLQLFQLS